jgi:hypothetical protein
MIVFIVGADFDPWTEQLPGDAPYVEIDGFLATTDVITADRLRLIKAGGVGHG